MPDNQTLWGIDMGGTKIEGVVLKNEAPYEVLYRNRIPTEKEKGFDHIIGRINKLVSMMKKETGLQPHRIGIGTPGNFDPSTGLHKNSNTTAINGQPFKKGLEDKLGLEIAMANDANCFAMAEAKMGAVPEHLDNPQVVFGVIMGTGVGGGIVVNGKVINGKQGIAGEWGHNFLDAAGGECYCGRIGCTETLLAGSHLEKYYKSLTGEQVKLKHIYENYKAGHDEAARRTIERLIHFFGKGIASIINVLDPDAIVLGGGVGNIDLLYTEGVDAARPHVFNPRLDTLFLKPKLGDSAGVFGAAFL